MATIGHLDPNSSAYLLRQILDELKSMNPYRMNRPAPVGDDQVAVEDPKQAQLPLQASSADVSAKAAAEPPEAGEDLAKLVMLHREAPSTDITADVTTTADAGSPVLGEPGTAVAAEANNDQQGTTS